MRERRKNFLINKPHQFRFMAYLTLPLLVICCITMLGLYFGVWGSVLDAFSDERIRNDLLLASRLTEYEQARHPVPNEISSLSFFQQAKRLSQRQREIFKEILNDTNRKLFPKFVLILFFIGWGSIYVSHKIAGPLYHFNRVLSEIDNGNLRVRVNLRQGDEARFLGERFSQSIEKLDLTFCRLKNIIRENEASPEHMTARLKEELSKIKTSDHT
ncbi:MAG: hypothetical protein Q8R76_04210 [Candidatus Omnitrophota bacterium]|nr:hypothetical protein [Candidatus Omnitrophota bacterium]